MKYADYLTVLDNHIASHPLKLGDGESVLTLLYESYEELQGCNRKIKEDFHELYCLLDGRPLTELDRIINPVCTLCRDHEQYGFINGVQVGVRLAQEIWE